MPILPSGPMVGLNLWASRPLTMAVELLMFGVGLWMYKSATTPVDRRGTRWLVATAVVLLVIYGLNMFSPAPPSVEAVAYSALAMWLLVAMGYKIDRHRVPVLA